MRHSKIAILGAGVAGLCSAIALHRLGFKRLTIYERRRRPTGIGAGLVLWANAMLVLERLDLLPEIARLGGLVKSMERRTKDNEFLGSINAETINELIGQESYAISRKGLQDILLKRVQALGIPIRFGQNAMALNSEENNVDIQFDNGTREKAHLALGADGRMSSTARRFVWGDNAPVYQNFVNWIAYLESPQALFSPGAVLDFWGVGERFGIVPIDAHRGYWAGAKAMPANQTFKTNSMKADLRKVFTSWKHPLINKIIDHSPEESINRIEVYDHDPIKRWHKERVCLLGDAAHAALPTSGQGACQAIEDAWHLAQCLNDNDHHHVAFERFQNTRFEKTNSITIAGRRLAQSLFHDDPHYCIQRNEMAKTTNYDLASRGIAKLWSAGLPA